MNLHDIVCSNYDHPALKGEFIVINPTAPGGGVRIQGLKSKTTVTIKDEKYLTLIRKAPQEA